MKQRYWFYDMNKTGIGSHCGYNGGRGGLTDSSAVVTITTANGWQTLIMLSRISPLSLYQAKAYSGTSLIRQPIIRLPLYSAPTQVFFLFLY